MKYKIKLSDEQFRIFATMTFVFQKETKLTEKQAECLCQIVASIKGMRSWKKRMENPEKTMAQMARASKMGVEARQKVINR
jgi:hypothetical protein